MAVGARGSDRWRVSLADDLRGSLLFLLLDKAACPCMSLEFHSPSLNSIDTQ